MRKIITTILIATALTSCVPQTDYDKLKSENEQLLSEKDELVAEISGLRTLVSELQEKKRIASSHTEAEALKHLKDYYEFYNSNFAYKKPKVRRVNENTFKISLQECVNKQPFLSDKFYWHSKVLTLRINEDGTYKVN